MDVNTKTSQIDRDIEALNDVFRSLSPTTPAAICWELQDKIADLIAQRVRLQED